uniref:Uncharacterized protein n=1 Tax=Micrurus spixii TaxID=129469 RepID=A0A2D4LER2_9SAUR
MAQSIALTEIIQQGKSVSMPINKGTLFLCLVQRIFTIPFLHQHLLLFKRVHPFLPTHHKHQRSNRISSSESVQLMLMVLNSESTVLPRVPNCLKGIHKRKKITPTPKM